MNFAMMQAVYYRTIELSQIEVAVLFALAGAAKDEKTNPSPSLKTIANRTALCIRSVSRGIKLLESKGIIEVGKRSTAHGKLCNEYYVDCTKLKGRVPNDCKSNMDCESNYNMSLKSLDNNMRLNDSNSTNKHNKTQGKTQEGSIEGDTDEGSNLTTKTHVRNSEPRSLEEIFKVLRKEYKQEFPAVAKFIDVIISAKFHEGQLPEKLLKELRDLELKGWPDIRSPLRLAKARLWGYVPHSLIGMLKMDLDYYWFEKTSAIKDLESAKRCKNISQIDSISKSIVEAEKKIAKTMEEIAEIEKKIREYKNSKCKRKSVAWLRHKGVQSLQKGWDSGRAHLRCPEGKKAAS